MRRFIARIAGYIREVFSLIALAGLYLVSQRRFDPKKEELHSDERDRSIGQPIILVHGYLHNSSGWIYHRYRLKKAGFDAVFTVNLGAIPTKSISEYAKVLQKRVQEVCHMTGRKDVKLIGHSMGGLVSAYYALHLAESDQMDISSVITLHSPLRGTKMQVIGIGPCAREMAYHSNFVKNLGEEIKNSKKTRFFHIGSESDLIVLPYYSALNLETDQESRNPHRTHIFSNVGHTEALFSREVVDIVIKYLNYQ